MPRLLKAGNQSQEAAHFPKDRTQGHTPGSLKKSLDLLLTLQFLPSQICTLNIDLKSFFKFCK